MRRSCVRLRWQLEQTTSHFAASFRISAWLHSLAWAIPTAALLTPRTWSKSITCGGYLCRQSLQGRALILSISCRRFSLRFAALIATNFLARSGFSRRHLAAFFAFRERCSLTSTRHLAEMAYDVVRCVRGAPCVGLDLAGEPVRHHHPSEFLNVGARLVAENWVCVYVYG